MSKDIEKEESGNDWDDFTSGAAPFWDKWGNTVLTGVLVVLVAVFAYRLYAVRQVESQNQAWLDLANSTTPQSMSTVALSNKGSAVGWLASIRAGNMYLQQARTSNDLTGLVPATTQPGGAASAVPTKEISLSQAAAAFNEVANDANADELYKLHARMGLAAVEESKGQFVKAQEIYLSVEKDAKESYPTIASQAAELAKTAPKLAQKLTYDTSSPLPFIPKGTNLPLVVPGAGSDQPGMAPMPIGVPGAPKGK
jgi:predicted negative regulator of RcsB-dependent stress response